MKITSNSAELLKSLQEYKIDLERRLTAAVSSYVREIVVIATAFTPLGDSNLNADMYLERYLLTGLQPEEGFARGSWQVGFDPSFSVQENYGRDSASTAVNMAYSKMLSEFKLGQTVVVGNTGPYIMNLENNFSKQTNGEGIVAPTLTQIQMVYKTDFKRMFDETRR